MLVTSSKSVLVVSAFWIGFATNDRKIHIWERGSNFAYVHLTRHNIRDQTSTELGEELDFRIGAIASLSDLSDCFLESGDDYSLLFAWRNGDWKGPN